MDQHGPNRKIEKEKIKKLKGEPDMVTKKNNNKQKSTTKQNKNKKKSKVANRYAFGVLFFPSDWIVANPTVAIPCAASGLAALTLFANSMFALAVVNRMFVHRRLLARIVVCDPEIVLYALRGNRRPFEHWICPSNECIQFGFPMEGAV